MEIISRPTRTRSGRKQYQAEIVPKQSPVIPAGFDKPVSTVSRTSFLSWASFMRYNPDDLVGKKGLGIYKRMARDEQVKAALSAKKYAVLSTGTTIRPPEVKEEADRELADELARFVDFNFEEMEGSFNSHLLEIMSALDYGYSVGEIILKRIDYGEFIGKIGLESIRFRRPEDIAFSIDEAGKLQDDGIVQSDKHLPASKFLLYSYRKEFGNYYGESDLRAVYRSYFAKDNLIKFMLIAMERYGEPIIDISHDGPIDNAQLAALDTFIQNLQSRSGLRHPKEITMELKYSPPQIGASFVKAIDLCDQQIRIGLLMPGLVGLSGSQQATGSYARAVKEFDLFVWIIEQLRNDIEAIVNEQIVKPLLIDLNYEVVGGQYPRFEFLEIDDEAKARMLELYLKGLQVGGFTKTDDDENKFRADLGLNKLPDNMPLPVVPPETQLSKADTHRHYASQASKRVDFAAIQRVFDKDSLAVDKKLRKEIATAFSAVREEVESLLVGVVDPSQVSQFRIDIGAQALETLDEYLLQTWRKGRDIALKELPASIRREIASIKEFQVGFAPQDALNYFKTRAIAIKGLIDDDLTKAVKFDLFEHLKGGRTTIETIGNLRRIFEPWIGDPQKIIPSGIEGRPESLLQAYRLENIIRTETTTALNQGRVTVGDAAGEYTQGIELSSVLDARTTDTCQAADGLMLRKDDPRTIKLTPSLHWNCRSVVIFITTDDIPITWSSDAAIDRAVALIPAGFK